MKEKALGLLIGILIVTIVLFTPIDVKAADPIVTNSTSTSTVTTSTDSKSTVRTNPPSACLLYTSPSPRDQRGSRMPSSA